jgi:transglutaminase-like putative cysteine protease
MTVRAEYEVAASATPDKGLRWAISVVVTLPALITALAMPLILSGAAISFAYAPAVLLVIALATAAGIITGLAGVVFATIVIGVLAGLTGFPPAGAVLAALVLLFAALLAWALARGRWPASAGIPGLVLLVLVLASGLASTVEGAIITGFTAMSFVLSLLLLGPGSGDRAVRPSRWVEAISLLTVAAIGIGAGAASIVLVDRWSQPIRLPLFAVSDPEPALDGSPPDPFLIAARWQLEPQESRRELFDLRVGEQAPQNRPAWAAFETYTGVAWLTGIGYGVPGDAIPAPTIPSASDVVIGTTRVSIGVAMPGQWVPAPQRITQVLSAAATRVDVRTGVVTAVSPPVSQQFDVRYEVAVATQQQLNRSQPATLNDIDPAILLPGPLPEFLVDVGDEVTEESGSAPWSRLLGLSEYLRSERFQAVPPTSLADGLPDRSYAGLVEVIASGQGAQEQYAAAWAVIARSWGIPTRLVIGWIPPEVDSAEDDTATVTVRGADTSVWAEARLTGLGWVAFQPSPQDRDAGRPAVVRPLRPVDAQPPSPSPDTQPTDRPTDQPEPDGADGEDPVQEAGDARWIAGVLLIVGVITLWMLFIAWHRRRVSRIPAHVDTRASALAAVDYSRALCREALLPLPAWWSPAVNPLPLVDLPDSVAACLTRIAEGSAPLVFGPPRDVAISDAALIELWGDVRALDANIVKNAGLSLRVRRLFVPLVVKETSPAILTG